VDGRLIAGAGPAGAGPALRVVSTQNQNQNQCIVQQEVVAIGEQHEDQQCDLSTVPLSLLMAETRSSLATHSLIFPVFSA